jgi:hypothetical protein
VQDRLRRGKSETPPTSLDESVASHFMAFAAEASRQHGMAVSLGRDGRHRDAHHRTARSAGGH